MRNSPVIKRFQQWIPNRDDLASQSTESLAASLLGAMLVCESGGISTSGIVVETEAYLGVDDRACHAFGGRKTPRLEALWLGPGRAYVYTIHRQWLLNITTQPEGVPQAILIRALWPTEGLETMAERRGVAVPADGWTARDLRSLTSGPGRLCRAMGIDRGQNGLDVLDPCSPLRLESAPSEVLAGAGICAESRVCCGPRVGVESAGDAALLPLRYWIEGNRLVSRR